MLLWIKAVFNAEHDTTDANKSKNVHKVTELEHIEPFFFEFFSPVYRNHNEVYNSNRKTNTLHSLFKKELVAAIKLLVVYGILIEALI